MTRPPRPPAPPGTASPPAVESGAGDLPGGPPAPAAAPPLPEYSRFPRMRLGPLRGTARWLQFALAWCFVALAQRVPVSTSQRMGRWLAAALFPLARRDRAICDYQLGWVYPELSPAERRNLSKRVFANLGMTLLETFALPRVRRESERWIKLEDEHVIREAYGRGRGVIFLMGHMANWELLSAVFERLEIPAQAVARPIVNTRLNDLLVRHRRSPYLEVVQRGTGDTSRQLLACLRNKQVLLVALDQDTRVPGVFVNFFGMPAYTPRVAASLALRGDVPVVSGFGRRLADGSHRFRFRLLEPPPGAGNNPEGVVAFTQVFSDAMEAHIRECPEQWSWNHRRWKRRPTDPGVG